MADLKLAIPAVRESVAAVFRLRQIKAATVKKGKQRPAQFQFSWGSAFCVVTDRYLVTAFHVLNGGQPRDPQDRFYALTVPGTAGRSSSLGAPTAVTGACTALTSLVQLGVVGLGLALDAGHLRGSSPQT